MEKEYDFSNARKQPLFSFETDYDMNTFMAMARALRMTVRKKHSKRSLVFGLGVAALGVASIIMWGPKLLTIAAIAVILLALLFQDRLNAWFAMKRMLSGMERAQSDFYEDRYVSATDIGTTEWHYDKIKAIAEDKVYFIFIFSESHTQAYDKRKMSGGTGADFRDFIMQKTGLNVQRM